MPISSLYISVFQRIPILDSIAFQLRDIFSSVYPGKQHDRTYGAVCAPTVTVNDLCIRDLDCFHLKDLQYIQDKEAHYISRIMLNPRIY